MKVGNRLSCDKCGRISSSQVEIKAIKNSQSETEYICTKCEFKIKKHKISRIAQDWAKSNQTKNIREPRF